MTRRKEAASPGGSKQRSTRAAVALALVAGLAGSAAAEGKAQKTTKKAKLLADKAAATGDPAAKTAWQAELRKRIGKEPRPVLNIFNTWTHEIVAVEIDQRRPSVAAARRAILAARAQTRETMKELANEHLRCHFTNEPAEMDARLFRVLVEAARHFGVERVEIISGFRAEKYNLMLRKKGRQVARNSQHTRGNAVDFRLRGVPTRRLRNFARALRLGGVGYYPSSGFVHVDVGPIRTWRGK